MEQRIKKRLLYLDLTPGSKESLLAFYKDDIEKDSKRFTITPNLDFFRLSYKSQELRNVFNEADYSTVDGKPVLRIAKWLKQKGVFTKISGSDLALDVLDLANENGCSLFLFGGKPGVAEKAKDQINQKWPNVNVVGCVSPAFGYEKDHELVQKYILSINEAKANIVFLCTGTPKTEKFFIENKEQFNNALYFSIGATIDFLAGTIKRAPKWMSNIGLEWLFRLFHDFRRLFKRYWLDGWFLIRAWFLCRSKKYKKNQESGS